MTPVFFWSSNGIDRITATGNCDAGLPWLFATKFAILFGNAYGHGAFPHFTSNQVRSIQQQSCCISCSAQPWYWWSWRVLVYEDGSRLKCHSHCSSSKFSTFSWMKAFQFLIFQSPGMVVCDSFVQFFHCFEEKNCWTFHFTTLEVLHLESSFNWNVKSYILSEVWVESLSRSWMT